MRRYILAHPGAFLLAALLGVVMQASGPLIALVSMYVIDAVNTGETGQLLSFIPIVAVLFAFFGLAVSFYGRATINYMTKMSYTLKKDLFKSIMDTSIADFSQEKSGNYISVMNNDIANIVQQYFASITEAIKFAATVAVAIIIMLTIHPLLALIVGVISFSPMIGPMIFSKQLVRTQLVKSTKAMIFNQKVKDYLSGFEVIKTFGVEKNIEPKFLQVADEMRKADNKAGAAAFNVGAVTIATVAAVGLGTYIIAGIFAVNGAITVGAVVAVSALSSYIQQPIHMISNLWGQVKSTKAINERVLAMMEKKGTKPRDVKISKLDGDVVFTDVSFSYNENGDTPALKNINYTFQKGKKYAIVGHSGSGKSTLTKLMMGYYDNYTGNAIMNGANVRDICRESLCNVVSVLPQSVFLLDDTLKNNVTLYNNYTDSEYQNAIAKANLVAVENALSNGADTILGEGGNTISYGERQRVAIARALLKGSDILILDEATANLDNLVAHAIEKSIVEMEDLTCIFVTHRYSKEILEQCDGILVMKDGEIFESGTFEELYGAKGYFYSLYSY